MKHHLAELQASALTAIDKVDDLTELQAIRVDFLGKKGRLTELLKQVSQLSVAEKPVVGQLVNQVKREIHEKIDVKHALLTEQVLQAKLSAEFIDVTLSGRSKEVGSLHPVSQIKHKINAYFSRLGFDIVDGPEIETEFYNFEALNVPAHHPARAMHDTFYFGDGSLLRTHTSSVQIRIMEQHPPP